MNSVLWRCQLSLNWPYISSNSNQILEGYFNTNLQVEFKMNIKRQIDIGKTYIYSQLSFDTCAKAFQWRKESLFNNWYFDNWISTCKKENTKLWLTFRIFIKNSKQIIDWNVKQKRKILWYQERLLRHKTKSMIYKEKLIKWTSSKLNVCSAKEANRMNAVWTENRSELAKSLE